MFKTQFIGFKSEGKYHVWNGSRYITTHLGSKLRVDGCLYTVTKITEMSRGNCLIDVKDWEY